MARVFVVGSINVDSVVEVERHPMPGETLTGGELKKLWGGKGANQAVAAARAGAEVVFVARVGDDDNGVAYRNRLAAFGVDVTNVIVTAGVTTGHAMIAVDANAENTIIVSPGANAHVSELDLEVLKTMQPDDILLAPVEVRPAVIEEAVRLAHAAGARVILNLAPYTELDPEVLAIPNPLIVNEHEAALLAESGAVSGSLLTTLGSAGSSWGAHRVAADRAPEVVDTTGAGDSYCGTLAAQLAAGASEVDAMRAASAAAAETVSWAGAQPALP